MLKIRTKIRTTLSNNSNMPHLRQRTIHMLHRLGFIRRVSSSRHHQELLRHNFSPKRQLPHMLLELHTALPISHHLLGLHLPSIPATLPVVPMLTLMRLVAVALMRM